MLKKSFVTAPNLAGGVNTGLHATLIENNEMAELVNFYVSGTAIYPRAGSTRISSVHLDGAKSAGCFKDSDGRFKLVTAGDTLEIFTPNPAASAPTTLTKRSGTTYVPTTNKRPFIFQGRHCFYFIDPAGGPLRRGTGTYYEDAGIAAPINKPVINSSATGVMTTADYKVAVTFYNSVTGDESDFSPVSDVLALTGPGSVDVSSIEVSTTPQVDKKRIWITPPDQSNLYLLADTIDNATTTANINLTPTELGELMPTSNGMPPKSVVAGAIFDNCLFVTDGTYLYKSAYLQFETFNTVVDVQPILNDDGHDCNVLYAWGNRLVAGKTNYVVYFTPTGSGDYIPTILSDKYGVYSPHAIRSFENVLIWFDGEGFQRSDNGATPKNISTIRIKRYLDRLAVTDKDNLIAEIAPRLNSYIVRILQNDGSTVVLAYNYKVDAWSVFSIATNPIFLIEGYDINEERQLYSISDGFHIDLMFDDTSYTDSGTAITYSWLSKGYKAEGPVTQLNFLRSVALLSTNAYKTVQLKVVENGLVDGMTIDAYLYKEGADWKPYALSTIRASSGAVYLQIHFTFTGELEPTFNISRLMLELLAAPEIQRQYTSLDV